MTKKQNHIGINQGICVIVCFHRLRTGWDKYIRQVSSEMVVKDTKMITLQERETNLRAELERSREEVER